MDYVEKSAIHERAKKIVASDLSWKKKYDMIFSEEVSQKFSLDYYDPDTSYEDDVNAFMGALDEYMAEQKIINNQIDNL
jgi:hypothetical protein